MVINIHAGHNPDGKVACGAVGLIKESTEARKVKEEVIRQLERLGHTIYDCTCDNGISQGDVLKKIVAKCNTQKVDLDVSIHFNAGAGDVSGNGKTTGTEVYVYSELSAAKPYAEKICKAIEKLGFQNRGVKYGSGLYILKHTKAPALLVECCFVDDKDDVKLYNYKSMATAIVEGIGGRTAFEDNSKEEILKITGDCGEEDESWYCVQAGAYRDRGNAEAMKEKLKNMGVEAFIVENSLKYGIGTNLVYKGLKGYK